MRKREDKEALLKSAQKIGCCCDTCPLRLKGRFPVLPYAQPGQKKMIICGEGPGSVEELKKQYFIGPSGVLLFDNIYRVQGVPRTAFYITNTTLCGRRKKLTDSEWKQAIKCCTEKRFPRELENKPKFILALGGKALQVFYGKKNITNWMGSELQAIEPYKDFRLFAALHPAFCLQGPNRCWIEILTRHCHRAYNLATNKIPSWSWPKLIVEPDQEAVDGLNQILSEKLPVQLDVETIGDPMTAKCMSVALSNEHVAISVPWDEYYWAKKTLQPCLESYPLGCKIKQLVKQICESGLPFIMQNGQHDILTMEHLGVHIKNFAWDTLIASRLLRPDTKNHKLSTVACVETHVERWKDLFQEGTDSKGLDAYQKRDPVRLRTYNDKDAISLAPIAKRQRKTLATRSNGLKLMDELMARNAICIKMRRFGIKIDRTKLAGHRKRLRARKLYAARQLEQLADRLGISVFNPNKAQDCQELFYDVLGVIVKINKDGRRTLDQKYLSKLIVHDNKLVAFGARALLRYRKWAKLRATYVDKLPIDKDGFIHPSWDCIGAKTFRFSCSNPSMMNIPKRATRITKRNTKVELVPNLRDIFVPHAEDGWIVKADYRALELRLMAYFAEDKMLLDLFNAEADVHTYCAEEMFGVVRCKKEPNLRNFQKGFVYASNYGAEDITIWLVMATKCVLSGLVPPSLQLVSWMRSQWFKQHPKIAQFQRKCAHQASAEGKIVLPISGHEMHFQGDIEFSKPVNYYIQHTGADIINLAFIAVDAELNWKDESIICQVHDELVLQGRRPERLAKLLWKYMPYKLDDGKKSINISIDVSIGKDFGNCVAVKNIKHLREVKKELLKCV